MEQKDWTAIHKRLGEALLQGKSYREISEDARRIFGFRLSPDAVRRLIKSHGIASFKTALTPRDFDRLTDLFEKKQKDGEAQRLLSASARVAVLEGGILPNVRFFERK